MIYRVYTIYKYDLDCGFECLFFSSSVEENRMCFVKIQYSQSSASCAGRMDTHKIFVRTYGGVFMLL